MYIFKPVAKENEEIRFVEKRKKLFSFKMSNLQDSTNYLFENIFLLSHFTVISSNIILNIHIYLIKKYLMNNILQHAIHVHFQIL